jgi:hypothetical protein
MKMHLNLQRPLIEEGGAERYMLVPCTCDDQPYIL